MSPCEGPTGGSNSTCLKPNSDCLSLILLFFACLSVNGINSPSLSVFSITCKVKPRLFAWNPGTWEPVTTTFPDSCPACCIPATPVPFYALVSFLQLVFFFSFFPLLWQSDCSFQSFKSSFEALKIAILALSRRDLLRAPMALFHTTSPCFSLCIANIIYLSLLDR